MTWSIKYIVPIRLYRDILYLIAEQISDPVTWYNFALSNSVTAAISKRLKDKKKHEFFPPNLYVPLQFWFNRNPGLALPVVALQYQQVNINLVG